MLSLAPSEYLLALECLFPSVWTSVKIWSALDAVCTQLALASQGYWLVLRPIIPAQPLFESSSMSYCGFSGGSLDVLEGSSQACQLHVLTDHALGFNIKNKATV